MIEFEILNQIANNFQNQSALPAGDHELEVYDLFGRLVLTQKVALQPWQNDVKLDVSGFRSGTYYLNMPGENWKYMPVRFVVARW